jgi:methylmalonyl-CoA mutase N-terminal domain/subunit
MSPDTHCGIDGRRFHVTTSFITPERGAPDVHVADADDPANDAERTWQQALARTPDRDELFTTISGDAVPRMSTPESAGIDYGRDLGYPGQYPYTRGVYPSMYRGRGWTQRQFAGFGTAAETNERFHYLLSHGQHGLSVAFDMPTLMGYDSDDDHSLGEVGREGVAVDSIEDMERLFEGVPLDAVTTSMTVNGPAPILLAFYVALAQRRGIDLAKLGGTIQTDILKEYIAQKEWLFPPEPSMRLVVDMIEYCTEHLPRWHPVSISGYHIREAGSTAAQELAFTLADGFAYVEASIERGLDVDSFAPRLSFFFNAHIDFFEEIAKLRAARRIWATVMRDRYGAKDPRSLLCRFHCQTAGVSLTWQQPLNNVARTAVEGMAAVLGGCQSLHTNSYDEALALPTEQAVQVALRTQQIIAEETGVTSTVDPLAGSYFVEEMTNRIERQAYEYFDRIAALGGCVEAVKQNFQQREIAEASYRYQLEVERGQRRVVGVNAFTVEDEEEIPILRVDPALEQQQADRVRGVRARRDDAAAQAAIERLTEAAHSEDVNLMPLLVEAAHASVTEGEIVRALKGVFGTWTETPVF